MNERTHFFIKIYLSHFILTRVDVSCVWEVNWRRGQTATYWPKVLLTIAALLSHSGWAAQPWVTEGPSPLSAAGSHSGILSLTDSNCNWNSNWLTAWLTIAVCGTWLYNCPMSTCFLWAYASATITEFNTSTGQGDIPIFSTGCTCFTVLPLIYTGASFDWRLGRGSIYNSWYPIKPNQTKPNYKDLAYINPQELICHQTKK